MLTLEFGHVLEIHAVDANQQGERDKDDSNDGQHFHDLIQAVAIETDIGLDEVVRAYADDVEISSVHKQQPVGRSCPGSIGLALRQIRSQHLPRGLAVV